MQGTTGNTVVGSLIGTNANGTVPMGNAGDGILLANSSHNTIGGVAASNGRGAANVIAFNDLDGVFIQSGIDDGIHENSIAGNGSLGIQLATGANLNQAAPVLTSVQASFLSIQVSGTLTSQPETVYTVEFFANDASGPSGRLFLGFDQCEDGRGGRGHLHLQALPPAGRRHLHHGDGDRPEQQYVGVLCVGVLAEGRSPS